MIRLIRSNKVPKQRGFVEFSRKSGNARAHLDLLLHQAWTPEIEAELFALAADLDAAAQEDAVRWSVWERVWRNRKTQEDDAALVRKAMAQTQEMLAKRGAGADESPALRMIRLHLEFRLGSRPNAALLGDVLELLGEPAAVSEDDFLETWELRHRILQLATLLAWRCEPEAADRFVARLDQWIERNPKDRGFREALHDYLTISARQDLLEARLKTWINADPDPDPWCIILGMHRLAAGRFADAAQILETVEEPSAVELTILAEAYGALENAEKRRASLDRVALAMDSWQVQQFGRAAAREGRGSEGEMRMPEQVARLCRLRSRDMPVFELYRAFRDERLLERMVRDLLGRESREMNWKLTQFQRLLRSQILDANDLAELEKIADRELANVTYPLEETALRLLKLQLAHHVGKASPADVKAFADSLTGFASGEFWDRIVELNPDLALEPEELAEPEPIAFEAAPMSQGEWREFVRQRLRQFGKLNAPEQAAVSAIVWANFRHALTEHEARQVWDTGREASLKRGEELMRADTTLAYVASGWRTNGFFRDVAFPILLESGDWEVLPSRKQAHLLEYLGEKSQARLTEQIKLTLRRPTLGRLRTLQRIAADPDIPTNAAREILSQIDERCVEVGMAPEIWRPILADLALARGFLDEARKRLAETGNFRKLAELALREGDLVRGVSLFLDAVQKREAHDRDLPAAIEASGDFPAIAAELTRQIRERGFSHGFRGIHRKLSDAFAEREAWEPAISQAELGFGAASLGLAEMLRKAGQIDKSRATAIRFLVESRPTAFEGSFRNALKLLAELGTDADTLWRAATHPAEQSPRDLETYVMLVGMKGEPAKQLEALRRFSAWEPDNPNWLVEQVDVLFRELKDAAGANEVLRQIQARTWDVRYGNVAAEAKARMKPETRGSDGGGFSF